MNDPDNTKFYHARLRRTVSIQKQDILYSAIQFQYHQRNTSIENLHMRDKKDSDPHFCPNPAILDSGNHPYIDYHSDFPLMAQKTINFRCRLSQVASDCFMLL